MPETRIHPIIIIPEDDDLDGELTRIERGLRDLRHDPDIRKRIAVIDLTRGEKEEREIIEYETQIINELDAATENSHRRSSTITSRNPSIPAWSRLSSFRLDQKLIKRGTLVEVSQRPRDQYCWQFIYVSNICVDATCHDTFIRGVRLARTRHMRGLLPKMKNEVCALYDIDKSDGRPDYKQAAVNISVKEVIRTRAFCKTNDSFPAHRFNSQQWKSIEDIENKGILVQRWKYYRIWPTPGAMATKKQYSGAVIRLRSADIGDDYFRVSDDKIRNSFRGGIVRGGSFRGGQVCVPAIELNSAPVDQNPTAILEHGQRYTADDMFCGAGGVSCGMQRAGFKVRLACDKDDAASKTYRTNFPRACFKHMGIARLNRELKTSTDHSDAVHQSPPCQVFSPAHTRTGKDDEVNLAALYLCGEVLERRRPRISTGEQTFGLIFDRNEEYFNALVGQYTRLGYSFSWDILRFREFGVPSTRRRLIWIASCPGEALPPFPAPTHADAKRGLPAPVTLRDVLGKIKPGSRRYDPLHNVDSMLYKARNSAKFPMKPYDDRTQVGTITTAGSDRAHPSGKRNFTLRELACIQGFPFNHRFVGTTTQVNRQIGNAFSPIVVETLYRHLKKWLLRQDRVMPRHQTPPDVIPLSVTERRTQRGIIILDPIRTSKVMLRPSRTRNPIILDGDNDDIERNPILIESDGESRNQRVRPGRSGQQTGDAILVDESGDVEMIDLIDATRDHRCFSRESSRTLSAESLPSVIEMEVDNQRDA